MAAIIRCQYEYGMFIRPGCQPEPYSRCQQNSMDGFQFCFQHKCVTEGCDHRRSLDANICLYCRDLPCKEPGCDRRAAIDQSDDDIPDACIYHGGRSIWY
jgi:hypothetical protein